MMSSFDDNTSIPPDQTPPSQSAQEPTQAVPSFASVSGNLPLAGDPISLAGALPDDLRISWSWVHLSCFILFVLAALAILPSLFAIPYLKGKQIPPDEMERYLTSIPQFVVGSTILLYSAILFFLYITLSVLTGKPFWHTLGWRKLNNPGSHHTAKASAYFLSGCGLSVIAAIVGSRVHTPDDMPIEALQKSKAGLMAMMAMAVAIAPLVEETVFRGYLYPILVRIISSITRFFGVEFSRATHVGVVSSILLTGMFFGLLHGEQLAWTWGIVGTLIFVGVTFTYVRARTGTVVASYFMHLGYNSLIAIFTAIGTHGFTQLPPIH